MESVTNLIRIQSNAMGGFPQADPSVNQEGDGCSCLVSKEEVGIG